MPQRELKEKPYPNKPGPLCGNCPYKDAEMVRGGGKKGGYMLVGQGPGGADVKAKRRYSGISGYRLKKQLGLAGILFDDCWVDDVVRCEVPKSRAPTMTAMRCCRPMLEAAIREVCPQTIITLGAAAFKGFYPDSKLTEYHGAKIKGDAYTLVPMFAPNAQDDNPNLLLTISRDYRGLSKRKHLTSTGGNYCLLDRMPKIVNSRFGYDSETTGLPLTSGLLGVSISQESGEGGYLPAAKVPRGMVFRDTAVMHNAKFDMGIAQSNGVCNIDDWKGGVDDTMLLGYVMEKSPLGLKGLAIQELGVEMLHFNDVAEGDSLEGTPDADVTDYAAADADVTLRLWDKLWKEATPRERRVYETLEKPLPPILAKMELAGVKVDIPYLHKLGERLDAELTEITDKLAKFGLDPELISKPAKIKEFIYTTLGMKESQLKTGKHGPTSRRVLERMKDKHDGIGLVLRFRELSSLKNNFVTGLLAKVIGCMAHPRFNQARVKTGRMSSSYPNFQGLPSRRTSDYRRAIVAPPGYVVAAFDNSQIDLRSLAHISQCPVLNKIFQEGGDIHAETSMLIYGDVEGTHRFEAKAANFMPVYGGTKVGLALRTGLEEDAADMFLQKWYEHYYGVTEWLGRLRQQALKDGYVETIYGRRLHIPELFTRTQAHALRIAQNMPIQGTSADVMKLQMIAVAPIALPFVQIHDELAFYLPKTPDLTDVLAAIKKAMENVDCPFPLVVECKVGPTLGDVEKVKL